MKRRKKGEPKADPPQLEMLLYDLSNDVGEKNNLAEENPALVTSLDQRMKELDAEVSKNACAPWKKL